ncbi:MAG: TetR/AcrR family transcriptional regulator [Elusimicrobiota bacterium]|jgi:AcrR family transcriptional regulator|nr:TetR/AcrR family transcriptional regulator [Elusimicrobiota bacterium]
MQKKQKSKEESAKEKIINTAFDLFAKKGIKDVSMREIAQACKFSKPVLYYYFKDKEDLCYQMIRAKVEEENIRIAELSKEKQNLEDFLIALFTAYVEAVKKKNVLPFMLHLHSYLSAHPKMIKDLLNLRRAHKKLFMDILQKETKRGLMAPAMEDTAFHLIKANLAHLILDTEDYVGSFKASYARNMARAVLRAVCYKGEIK